MLLNLSGFHAAYGRQLQGPRLSKAAGRGRMGGPLAAGPGGVCICPQCGHTLQHDTGEPCDARACPKCGAKMARQAEGEIRKAKPPLGSGERFRRLKGTLAKRGDVRDPGAVSAHIGRKKYGKKRFQQMAAAGRKRA